jgi:hypothetical protein
VDYPFLARRIQASRWQLPANSEETHSVGLLRADAITNCLNTYNDTLSCWETTGEEVDLLQVELTMVCYPKARIVDSTDIIWFPKSEIELLGIAFEHNADPREAQTLIPDMIPRHVNMTGLNLNRLSKLAELTLREVSQAQHFKRLRAKALRAEIATALQQHRLDGMTDELRSHLKEQNIRTEF